MKHSWPVTLFLTGLFVLAQLIGVGTAAYAYEQAGSTDVETPTGVGERPDTTGWTSILFILAGIALSTIAILYLAKTNTVWVWQAWFALASFIALYLFLTVFTTSLPAAILAATLAYLRSRLRSPALHNIVELFMYAGIALFLAPLFTVNTVAILLLIMSVYDAYAVWSSKHMVTLADFTRSANTFPGLSLGSKPQPSQEGSKQAGDKASGGVLGGGDILFPLLFTITAFFAAVTQVSTTTAILYALLITTFTTISLLTLFITSQKDAYYPALPFLTTGCYVGLILVRVIHTF